MPQPRFKRADVVGAIASGLIIVVFCLVLLWHDPLVFWNDDYELSVLPVFADVARSWSEGQWPLLSPYSWVCSNLAGEFQYGTFSLFVNAAVVLIWKFPLTFPQQAAALSMAQLFVLAAGAFLLARHRTFSISLSFFVASIAALNGWIICWGAIDWFGALAAFAWLPWSWWALERALDQERSRWRFLWPAPFVYLLVTGGFPYTVVMLLVLIAWLSIRISAQTKTWTSMLPMLSGTALGFGISAPAWLAVLDYVHGSARELQPSSAHWQWIVPWRALPGFILPCWTVNWADFSTRYLPHAGTELACGLVAPAALVAGFIWRPRMLIRRMKWELILLAVLLLLCMVPTAGLFRWSFRWLPFFHLVLGICAAEVLRVRPGSPTGSASVLLLIVATVAMSILNTGGKYGVALMLIYFQIAIVWATGEWFLRDAKFREWAPTVVTLGILLATYVCIPPNGGVPKYNLSQELLKPAPLDPQRLYLSVYPPAEQSYRLENKPQPVGQVVRPGSTSMWAGLRFINGYSPIRPSGVARYFHFEIHGELNLHVGEYLLLEKAGRDGELAQLGVDGVAIAREINVEPRPASEWNLIISNDEGRVYHRSGLPLARVRSVEAIASRPNEQFAIATISNVQDSRNYVQADVDVPVGGRPALLTFSRPFFPGYVATLAERKLAVGSYRGLFPIVELPPGRRGQLVLRYRPVWLVYGGVVAMLCLVTWLGSLLTATSALRSVDQQSPPIITAKPG